MSWFDDVSAYILNHLEDYATTLLKAQSLQRTGKTIFVNSCPFCDHNGCFSLTKDVNAAKCFSCGKSGTLIQIVQLLYGEIEGLERLAEWSKIKNSFASYTPEQAEAREKHVRFQRICEKAIDFYHHQLLENNQVFYDDEKSAPGTYQKDVRKHNGHGIKKYKVGYSGNWQDFKKSMLEEGYDEEEIKRAAKLVSFPPGYFIYPYFNKQNQLIRINAKLFIRYCRGTEKKGGEGFTYGCDVKYAAKADYLQKSHETTSGHVMNSDSLSHGDKDEAFFFHPKDMQNKKKKYGILVEGENDVISTDETLQLLPDNYKNNFTVIGIGGSTKKGMFDSELLREFEELYECFDPDEAGNRYREQLDTECPDIPVKRMTLPGTDDIDAYLKLGEQDEAAERLKALIDTAKYQTTKNYKLYREGKYHHWTIKNRHYGLRYDINYYQAQKNGYNGSLLIFKNGLQTEKKVGDIDACKVNGDELQRLKTALSNKIDEYYNDIRWVKDEPKRPFEELLDIFHCSKKKPDIIKQLAWYIHFSDSIDYEEKVRIAQKRIKNSTDIDLVLKEVNGFENTEVDVFARHPTIKLAQAFFPANRDGYIYFVKTLMDGESIKQVPCLLSNKKKEIRLDFMKKKTAQSLLLIENKYKLPVEVETNFVNIDNLSLQYAWVDKWKNDQIPDEELEPSKIIGEIEDFIRKTYYTTDDVIKVLALWIYATYYYSLFPSGFPYLQFTGAKGTGKSTLDDIINLLAFNPTFAVSITGPALFRQVGIFGGTFILDEQENLVDANKVAESDLAAVIKAGYSNKGEVIRFNKENGWNENFTPFCPKVISNINGLDDVIGDRCIVVTTYKAPEEKVKKLQKTDYYKEERRDEVYDISSRAALSALIHFGEVDRQAKKDNRMDTGSLRLTQILEPLVTLARVVGGDYEEHLRSFYQSTIQSNKAETELSTLEGKLKYVLVSISEEILGLAKRPWILGQNHLYDRAVEADKATGQFAVDSMHLKVFAEELSDNPNESFTFKQIHTAMKHILPRDWDFKNKKTDTKATVNDEGLLKQMNGKRYPRVSKYYFNAREFITKQQEIIKYKEDASETLF